MAEPAVLARALGCPLTTATAYAEDINNAMVLANCTTANRAAMYLAQIGHESGGLRHMEELASGAAYEGRRDLGNTVTGDGRRFRGRGPIQLTGRANYLAFGCWAHARELIDRETYFVEHPAVVATSRWGFLAAAWYWAQARPRLNEYADAGNVLAATRAINGGTNGLADRTARWETCRRLGDALLPTPQTRTAEEDDVTPEQDRMLRELYMQLVQGDGRANDPKTWGWPGWAGGTGEHLTVVDRLRRADVEIRQLRNQVADLAKKITGRN